MVHVIYDINAVNYSSFFRRAAQQGSGAEPIGSVFSGIPYQRGFAPQRGRGLGGLLGGLWRVLSPAAKNILADVGKESLAAGGEALKELASGGQLKNVLGKSAKIMADGVIARQQQRGAGSVRRPIPGRGFTRSAEVHQVPDLVPQPKRKRRGDIFGTL